MTKSSEKLHKDKINNQDIAKEIQIATRDTLLPSIQNKAQEVAKFIEKESGKINSSVGLSATQILPIIANRSLSDIATITNKTYTPQELGIAFNIYVEMIQKINKHVKFPPSKSSFCLMLGVSVATYNNYMQDQDKSEIMNIIDTYITGSKLQSAQTGELKEISTMFDLKSQHGFVEASTPIVIQHESKVDIADIQSQLKQIKNGRKVFEAEWKEIDSKSSD